jgi:carboxyl-terminal processing protease
MVELVDPYGRHHMMRLEPASPPQASYRRDAERVLELRLPRLGDAALGEAERALRERPAPSLVVLDLRGSRGGAGAIALRVMELFVQGGHEIARVETRDGEPIRQGGQTVVPLFQRIQGRDLYAGPMAVLIDAATASSSELLAGGLQLLERASLIGEVSCGCMNPSLGWFALPGGAQPLISDPRLPLAHGPRIERVGLQPDYRSEYSDAPFEARRLLLPSQARAPQ